MAMEQTLAGGRDVDLRGIGLVVFDEAHHAPCNYLRLALRVPCLLLGLSATPFRKDGTSAALFYMFGQLVPMHAPRPTVHVHWVRMPTDDVRMQYANGKPLHVQSRRRLAEHEGRQAVLLELLRGLREEGRRVLALTDFVDHAVATAEALGVVAMHGRVARRLDGEALLAEYGVVVATQALVKEGTDWPSVDTLVLLLPPSSLEQTVGRLRPRGADFEPRVYDCVDKALYGSRARRLEFYTRTRCVLN